MELREGQLVTPTIRLLKLLGQGGMGSVWTAENTSLQTQVAVKFLSKQIAGVGEAVARFKQEATAAAQIRSPHVVQIFDHGVTDDGAPYMVMELLDGEDLGHRLERAGVLAPSEACTVVTHACRALSRAHAAKIVHRDIKPENLFLTDSDGELFVKVLDFGIAKRDDGGVTNMTSTGAMIGTPYYMSPEQALSSKSVDHRADIWSLAVVTYYALTGQVPFPGETVGAVCVALDRAEFTPPSQLRPSLPPALDAWFATALARKPDQRFGSAREMADQFAIAIGDEPPASRMSRGAIDGPLVAVAAGPQRTLGGASLSGQAGQVGQIGQPAPSRRMLVVGAFAGVVALGAVGAMLFPGGTTAPSAAAQGSAALSASAEEPPMPAAGSSGPPAAAPGTAAGAVSAAPVAEPPAASAVASVVPAASAAAALADERSPRRKPAGKAPPAVAAPKPHPTGGYKEPDRGF
jgi:eukaryotic-like serine/threonine-protein kinase